MSSDVAVASRGLTKVYRVFERPADRIKQSIFFGARAFYRPFTALDDVSFEIRKGETVGIVGRNGSGKSTLLQLICGILKATAGEIAVNGRISALLELGAGFHPEFTGRENVRFMGAILGLKRDDMEQRLPEIEAFADISDFMDQPVRTYSSGMFVRLAFAVAIHVDPDILVIDEALAVGDMSFQAKCMSALHRFRQRGVTILFVSHDINAVKSLCGTALYLDHGRLRQSGPAAEVAEAYLRDVRLGLNAALLPGGASSPVPVPGIFHVSESFLRRVAGQRYGSGEAEITDVELLDEQDRLLDAVEFGQPVRIRIHLRFRVACAVVAAYYVRDNRNLQLIGSSTLLEDYGTIMGEANDARIVEFATALPLEEGDYNILAVLSLQVVSNQAAKFVDYVENALVFKVLQRQPVRVWSRVYVGNTVTVRNG